AEEGREAPSVIQPSLRPWMALRAIEGLGDISLRRLIAAFGSPEGVFSASHDELISAGELTLRQADALLRGPNAEARSLIDRELGVLAQSRATIVTCIDTNFPPRLREIPDPPLYL